MSDPPRIGVLGGTFDPIHVGHLDAADAARRALSLDRVLVVPAADPPHRPDDPRASVFHRFALVSLAIADRPELVASDIELQHPGPSYTSLTLQRLAATGFQPAQLYFIVGADAFAEIATWHDYPALLDRAHFAVVTRPGVPPGTVRARVAGQQHRFRAAEGAAPTGPPAIWLIRAATRDVSSTDVRARIARGEPITGLLPPAVEAHVARHGLYGHHPVSTLHEHNQA